MSVLQRDTGMSKVVAVCRSEEKGTTKDVVAEVVLKEEYGVENDAHASSNTHRQVSLLGTESIQKMRDMGLDVGPGDFAENITTEGLDLCALQPGERLSAGEAVLEVTRIGKDCHNRCRIYDQVGDCAMPREGVFARVVKGGKIGPGEEIRVLKR